MRRNLCPWAAPLLAVLLIVLGFPKQPTAAEGTTTKEANADDVVLRIAGTDYHIPRNYLAAPPRGYQATDLLLNALLPKLEGRDPDNSKIFREPGWGAGRLILILVYDAQATTSFEFRLGVVLKRYEPLTQTSDKYGLTSYLAGYPSEGASIIKNNDPNRAAQKHEIDIEESTVGPSLYLDCAGDESVPAPDCIEVFRAKGLLFHLTFAKRNLRDWQTIRKSVLDLFERFSSL